MAAGYLFEWELFAAGGAAACCLLLRSQDVADVVLSLVGIPSAWDIVVGRFRTGGETYDNIWIGLCIDNGRAGRYRVHAACLESRTDRAKRMFRRIGG